MIEGRRSIILFSLGVVMILWFLSGRTVGIIPWPDGRVNTGWFYIPTERFYLCNGKTDCDAVIDYHTKTETLPFWRVRIKNESIDKTIFVGPFLWSSATKFFKDKIEIKTTSKKFINSSTQQPIHFTIGDDSIYRLEKDIIEFKAIGSFSAKDYCKNLIDQFDQIFNDDRYSQAIII